MSLSSPSKEIKVEPKGPVVTSRKANGLLITFGLILIVAFAYGVFYARDSGSVVEETPAAKATGSTTEAKAKTITTKNAPSDSLLTAVLATAGALLLVGVLYGRISTIKLPGGAEISLTDEEKEKTAEKAAEKHPDDPKQAAMVAQDAQEKLLREKAYGSIEVPEEKIDSVVEAVS